MVRILSNAQDRYSSRTKLKNWYSPRCGLIYVEAPAKRQKKYFLEYFKHRHLLKEGERTQWPDGDSEGSGERTGP
jgi:hypothetical protein